MEEVNKTLNEIEARHKRILGMCRKIGNKPKDFGIKEGFIRLWIKHSNLYGNGFFEYEYEVEVERCSFLLDTLKEQIDPIEIVIAHLSYGDFMNIDELSEYLENLRSWQW